MATYETDGVCYLIQGKKHWARLVVSLWTLRRYWSGPVCLFYGDDNGEQFAELAMSDKRLGDLSVRPVRYSRVERHGGYCNKPRVMQQSPFRRSVFIDADTLIAGRFDELWPTQPGEIVQTQFGDWVTTGNIMSGRIRKWGKVRSAWAIESLSHPYPAINTGVFAWDRDAGDYADEWLETTLANISFMCDEIAAQLMYPPWKSRVRLVSDKYNCSPLFGEHKSTAAIWHFHGSKHLRLEASPIWIPAYDDCVQHNAVGITDWQPAEDKRLKDLLRVRGHQGERKL